MEQIVRLGPELFGLPVPAEDLRQVGVPGTPKTLPARSPRAVGFTAGCSNWLVVLNVQSLG